MNGTTTKWPKVLPELTPEEQGVHNDFMRRWHEVLPRRYGMVERFNHSYPVRHSRPGFRSTMEIGAGLGETWEILANAYKPYPCGVVLFPVIDACLELRRRIAVPVDQIAEIAVRGHPLLRERTEQLKLLRSADSLEGVAAWMQKREPKFQGQ